MYLHYLQPQTDPKHFLVSRPLACTPAQVEQEEQDDQEKREKLKVTFAKFAAQFPDQTCMPCCVALIMSDVSNIKSEFVESEASTSGS